MDENVDLEEKFNDAAKILDKEKCIYYRKKFVNRLAHEILDNNIGISLEFLQLCEDLKNSEIESKSSLMINMKQGINSPIRDRSKNFIIGYLGERNSLNEFPKMKDNTIEGDDENLIKKKEDQSIKTTNRYFGFHMNNVRAVTTVGSNSVKNAGFSALLSHTAKVASSLSVIGITLTYLTSTIFDDDMTKMKKHTKKMADLLRKETDFKLYTQSIDELQAQFNSISKFYAKFENMNESKDSNESQIMIYLLQSCDVIYEKIIQKKVFYINSIYFLEIFYFFVRIHIELVKIAKNKFAMNFYNTYLTTYIQQYEITFKEYLKYAKKMRSESFIKTINYSSMNVFHQIVANQYKIFENLVDEYNSEVVIRTQKIFTYNELISGNVFASISNLYYEIDKLKEKFFDVDEILILLKSDLIEILNRKFECIEESFTLYLTREAQVD